jgi:hypothetical protein
VAAAASVVIVRFFIVTSRSELTRPSVQPGSPSGNDENPGLWRAPP